MFVVLLKKIDYYKQDKIKFNFMQLQQVGIRLLLQVIPQTDIWYQSEIAFLHNSIKKWGVRREVDVFFTIQGIFRIFISLLLFFLVGMVL